MGMLPNPEIDYTEEEDRTIQSYKDECDIHLIVQRHAKQGTLSHLEQHGARYDAVPAEDYELALMAITEANSLFTELPATTREQFENDPGRFLRFVQDPAHRGKLKELLPDLARPEVRLPDPAGGAAGVSAGAAGAIGRSEAESDNQSAVGASPPQAGPEAAQPSEGVPPEGGPAQ